MAARIGILPSPLLPAAAYAGLAEALGRTGAESWVADPRPAVEPVDDLIRRWAADSAHSDLLVAHSNAGYVAPLVRARTDSAAPIVFVDAALLPAAGESPLAPAPFRDILGGLADAGGVLPAWTRWWPPDALAGVIPDDLVDTIDRGCPRLPLAYFDQRIEAPPAWAHGPNAYLAFGGTYAAELEFARDHSWPTATIGGGHLHFLHEPRLVADRLLTLASALR